MLSMITDNLTTFLATWVVLTSVFALAYKWWRKPHRNFPPGPIGVPLLGVLPYLGDKPQETIRQWSEEKYGPVMSIRMGLEDVVVLNSYDAISQGYVRQANSFSGRPSSGIFQLADFLDWGMSFKQYDSDYKCQKTFFSKSLKDYGVGKLEVDKLINEEADIFNEYLKDKEGQLINFKDHFFALTANAVLKFLCGTRYDYDDPTAKALIRALQNEISDSKLGLVDLFPILRWFPVFSSSVNHFRECIYHLADFIASHWDQHKASFNPNHLKDFMDMYQYEQKFGKGEMHAGFKDRQLRALGIEIISAGVETTSAHLSWCLHLYTYYSEHQAALEKEISKVFGARGAVTQAHKPQTPFLNAFIQEVFRITSVAPMLLKRSADHSGKLMGYDIPAGTTIIPNFHAVHMDPTIWPEPEKFDPYRHIDKEGKFVHSHKIIPFSIGPRSCPGEQLARVEVYIYFAKLLQKYKILPGDQPPHIDGITSVVHFPKPYEFRIKQR